MRELLFDLHILKNSFFGGKMLKLWQPICLCVCVNEWVNMNCNSE